MRKPGFQEYQVFEDAEDSEDVLDDYAGPEFDEAGELVGGGVTVRESAPGF